MTDEQIIKALEDARYHLTSHKHKDVINEAIDLIKRQQAEIDRLQTENERGKTNIYKMAIDKALAEKSKAETIKEFAHKLKVNRPKLNTGEQVFYIRPEEVDELVKEMVGDSNA